jgi:hypothetical protein
LTEKIIITGCSLPVNLEYKDAIKVELTNPTATRISSAALEFHPYFVFEYTLNVSRKEPVGSTHPIKNTGIHIVDALNGRFLSPITFHDTFLCHSSILPLLLNLIKITITTNIMKAF